MDVPHDLKIIDHIISIVGWGYDKDSDKQYWIIRNSWGEYWGERGFMRLVAGENQLGTEKSCAWAIPTAPTRKAVLVALFLTAQLEQPCGVPSD